MATALASPARPVGLHPLVKSMLDICPPADEYFVLRTVSSAKVNGELGYVKTPSSLAQDVYSIVQMDGFRKHPWDQERGVSQFVYYHGEVDLDTGARTRTIVTPILTKDCVHVLIDHWHDGQYMFHRYGLDGQELFPKDFIAMNHKRTECRTFLAEETLRIAVLDRICIYQNQYD